MNTQLIKTGALSTLFFATAFAGSAQAHHNNQNGHTIQPAPISGSFFGKWKNVNPNTRGITQLKIKNRPHRNKVAVKAWGQCHPNDCQWGKTKATFFKNQQNGKKKLVATFVTSFKESTLIMTKIGPNRMRVQNFTRFTDNSGRAPYFSNTTMKRAHNVVIQPRRQDVAIVDMKQRWNSHRGRYIVKVTVKNLGNKAAGNTRIELERSRTGRPVLFASGKQSLRNLQPGEQRTVKLTLPFRPAVSGRLQVHAQGSNGADKNLYNNKRKVTF